MSSDAFSRWRKQMGFSRQDAADALGLSVSRIYSMLDGTKRSADAKETSIPALIDLACAAVAAGLEPFGWDEALAVTPPAEVARWRREMGEKAGLPRPLSLAKAAKLLYLSNEDTIGFWEKGVRRGRDKTPAPVHRDAALALAAVYNGLDRWSTANPGPSTARTTRYSLTPRLLKASRGI